jgi:hypothetical protein
MLTEPSRQVHLDFHTSEHLPGIGARFSKAQFQEALKLGRLNQINIFAKCHHSWSYYPTRVGVPHPNLACDLLGGQIEACHEIGVVAPIYYTMGWSAHDAETHPEWCMRDLNGRIVGDWGTDAQPDDPKPGFQWKHLCPSGDYHGLILAQTEEICRLYPVDGFFYDIYQPQLLCYCERCRRGMADAGLDAGRPEQVEQWRGETLRRHMAELRRLILGLHPGASVFFNGTTHLAWPQNLRYRLYASNTKNDLEDLPTTWGGYDKLPLRAKFFLKENKPIVAMSGKFHTSWGEFGGFKAPEAIRYEAASMIAFGARCNFGDQLHPCGEMDLATYAGIGHAYDYVEKIEEFGIGGTPVASLALWMAHSEAHDDGVARMLLEEQIDFDVVGPGDDLNRFETVVVPSAAGTLDDAATALAAYTANGGALLILGEGALDAARRRFVVDVGAEYVGPRRYDVDYTVVGATLAAALVQSPFLNYEAAARACAGSDAEVLAGIREPYFSRTQGSYCGHQNTPYRLEDAEHPAVLRRGNVVWIAHNLDTMYHAHGAKVHRQLFVNALRLIHRRPMAEAALPSAGRISLLHQPSKRRYVLHLLYAPPLQRGRCLVIEDIVPVHGVGVTLRVPETIRAARLPLESSDLPMQCDQGAVTVSVPTVQGHQAVVFEYADQDPIPSAGTAGSETKNR